MADFTWFETPVKGRGAVVSILQDTSRFIFTPPFTLSLTQRVKDNRANFKRLCEDAATLTVVVYLSRQQSEDPDGWPGPGLEDAVDNFLVTLNRIAEFAQARVGRGLLVRVMNSAEDGDKIREYCERLAQAMNQFQVSAHLRSYEILRSTNNIVKYCKNRLNEPVSTPQESKEGIKEGIPSHLPVAPSEADPVQSPEEQVVRSEDLAESLLEEQARKKEQKAKVDPLPSSRMAPRFVNDGADILSILRDAPNSTQVPYLIRATSITTSALMQFSQSVKNYKPDFCRLYKYAATLIMVVYESRKQSKDPGEWPGPGLEDAVDNFLVTLNRIAEFAQARIDRGLLVRVMNSVEDGDKIREYHEILAQAMNRFQVSAHLQSYDILRIMKNMLEDCKNRLNQVSSPQSKEDVSSNSLHTPSSAEADENPEEQAVKQEARKKEQRAEVLPLPALRMAPRFGLSGGSEERKKTKTDDFQKLCEDVATLTEVVYESHQQSEDPDGWPGPGLEDAVDSFLVTLNRIAEFAQARVGRGLLVRVMNSAEDGDKIREYCERLAQAMNRFQVFALLQSYEILGLLKNRISEFRNRLYEQVSTPQEPKEDVCRHSLSIAPSDKKPGEQVVRDEELLKKFAEEQAEQEARKKEQAAPREIRGLHEKLIQAMHRFQGSFCTPPILRYSQIDAENDRRIVSHGKTYLAIPEALPAVPSDGESDE